MSKFAQSGKSTKSFNLVESIISKDIINRSPELTALREESWTTKLILGMNTIETKRKLIGDYLILLRVLQTRGRLRWLCLNLSPDIFPNTYSLSRWRLCYLLIINWNKFRLSILSKLFEMNSSSTSLESISPYEYSHPDVNRKILIDQKYILQNAFNRPGRFIHSKAINSDRRNNPYDFLLSRLILQDSHSVKKFLRHSNLLSNVPYSKKILKLFPDLSFELENDKKFKVLHHKSSEITFDERYESDLEKSDYILDVEIWYQRFIIKDSAWVLIDSTCSPRQDFVAGQWQFIEKTDSRDEVIFLAKPSKSFPIFLDEAIYLMGRADENWYHFIMDTLPRFIFLRDIKIEIPILVRSDLPRTTIDFIRKLMPNPLVLVEPDVLVKVSRLHFVAGRSTTYDSPPVAKLPQVEFSPQTISATREFILNSHGMSFPSGIPQKIYLPRNAKYRNLVNRHKISKTLNKAGFEEISVDENFFKVQHLYFQEAEIIACPGGATLANMIFMKPNSRILVFRSLRDLKQKLWYKLAAASGINLQQIYGLPLYYGPGKLRRQHSDYFCPNFILRLILRYTKD